MNTSFLRISNSINTQLTFLYAQAFCHTIQKVFNDHPEIEKLTLETFDDAAGLGLNVVINNAILPNWKNRLPQK